MKYRVFEIKVTFPGTPPHALQVELAAFASSDDEALDVIEERLMGKGLPMGSRLENLRKIYELDEDDSKHLARYRNAALTLDPANRDLVA